jgi:autotransporter-associated beta strand protein
LTKSGSGTLIFTNNNTYTGPTTIDGGVLNIGGGGTTGTIAAGSDIINNGSLVIDRANSLTLQNGINGSGSVAIQGGGTITFNSALDYLGSTTIESNSHAIYTSTDPLPNSSSISVNSGATLTAQEGLRLGANATQILRGNGTIIIGSSRTLEVGASGTIYGGSGWEVGKLTIQGTVDFSTDDGTFGVLVVNAGTPTDPIATPGGSSTGTFPDISNHSVVVITGGSTTLADLSDAKFKINGNGASFTAGQSYSYKIAQVESVDLSGLSITDPQRFSFDNFTNSNDFAFSVTGDSSGFVYLNVVPVPEPATVLGVAVGALAVGGFVRGRWRKPVEGAASRA